MSDPDFTLPESGTKGRVLRVKLGYNPNSSSVGTSVPKFLAFAVTSGALATLLLHLRSFVAGKLRKKREEHEPENGASNP